jgi:4-hydroxyproline epimerase
MLVARENEENGMSAEGIPRVKIIDSHTGGEPTRLVVKGGPDLGQGALAARLERFRTDYDDFRSAVVNEPRGSDVIVGALLCDPVDRTCAAGVIFFNNVGYLGMCGHGTIGLVATLAFMNRITPGEHRIETPVGTVSAILQEDGKVTVNNVASHRTAANVSVNVPGYGEVRGSRSRHEPEPEERRQTDRVHVGRSYSPARKLNHRRHWTGN